MSYDDYEFRGSVSSSGRVNGSWHRRPDPSAVGVFLVLVVGIPLCLAVWFMATHGVLGTGEPPGPSSVPSDYRGVWTAKAVIPGETGETEVRVSVPTATKDESRVEFRHPRCVVRMKADIVMDHVVDFSLKGIPTGRSDWCQRMGRVELNGDWGGSAFDKKLSDKVTLTVRTTNSTDDRHTFVDAWPLTRLADTAKPVRPSERRALTALPKAFNGTWRGPVTPGSHTERPRFSVVLRLTGGAVGRPVGTISYPGLGCRGTVRLLDRKADTATRLSLQEVLTHGSQEMCGDNVDLALPEYIDLRSRADGKLDFGVSSLYGYGGDGKPSGEATLTRRP
ncbi:hypothetical protein ACWEF9_07540 [Streptomyces sp. NPDC004980]